MSFLEIAIATFLFGAVPIGLCRPRGQRLLGIIGTYCAILTCFTILFLSFTLSRTLFVAVLYGPRAVLTGSVWIVRSRDFVELSNGDRYGGGAYFLWMAGTFAILATVAYLARRLARLLQQRLPLVRRVVARLATAVNSEPERTLTSRETHRIVSGETTEWRRRLATSPLARRTVPLPVAEFLRYYASVQVVRIQSAYPIMETRERLLALNVGKAVEVRFVGPAELRVFTTEHAGRNGSILRGFLSESDGGCILRGQIGLEPHIRAFIGFFVACLLFVAVVPSKVVFPGAMLLVIAFFIVALVAIYQQGKKAANVITRNLSQALGNSMTAG
jgi:hypothetical protein